MGPHKASGVAALSTRNKQERGIHEYRTQDPGHSRAGCRRRPDGGLRQEGRQGRHACGAVHVGSRIVVFHHAAGRHDAGAFLVGRHARRMRSLRRQGQRLHGQAGQWQSGRGQLQAADGSRQGAVGRRHRQDPACLPVQAGQRPVRAIGHRWAARNDVGRGCREAARFSPVLCGRSPHAVRPFARIRAGRRAIAPCPRRWAQSVRRTTLEPARQQQGVLP